MARSDERETIAYGLWKSGIIKPQNKNDWNDLGPGPQTPYYKAADAIIAEQATRSAKGVMHAHELTEWADTHKLSTDWHEPDNNLVSARVVGDHLDNAKGHAITMNEGFQEYVVILAVDGKDSARVNLADLLAWATAHGRSF